jgi:hypothetical protein
MNLGLEDLLGGSGHVDYGELLLVSSETAPWCVKRQLNKLRAKAFIPTSSGAEIHYRFGMMMSIITFPLPMWRRIFLDILCIGNWF